MLPGTGVDNARLTRRRVIARGLDGPICRIRLAVVQRAEDRWFPCVDGRLLQGCGVMCDLLEMGVLGLCLMI
jgi:hypothetical protein